MATKYINPNTLEDYTTLAAWEAGQIVAGSIGIARGDGDVGVIDMDFVPSGGNGGNRRLVVWGPLAADLGWTPAEPDFGHNGSKNSSRVYIQGALTGGCIIRTEPNCSISGFEVREAKHTSGSIVAVINCSSVIQDLLVWAGAACTSYALGALCQETGYAVNPTLRNCVFITGVNQPYNATNPVLWAFSLTGCISSFYDITMLVNGDHHGMGTVPGVTQVGTFRIRNCISIGTGATRSDFAYLAAQAGVTYTCSNNLSSDATADDKGGAGHIINANKDGVVVNRSSDGKLTGILSPAFDKGADLSAFGFTTDMLGTTRPQYTAWDIGAHEYPEPVIEAAGDRPFTRSFPGPFTRAF